MKDEDLGRLVNDICNAAVWLDGIPTKWKDLDPRDRDLSIKIGRALYNAGFQAGTDSVKQ